MINNETTINQSSNEVNEVNIGNCTAFNSEKTNTVKSVLSLAKKKTKTKTYIGNETKHFCHLDTQLNSHLDMWFS